MVVFLLQKSNKKHLSFQVLFLLNIEVFRIEQGNINSIANDWSKTDDCWNNPEQMIILFLNKTIKTKLKVHAIGDKQELNCYNQ